MSTVSGDPASDPTPELASDGGRARPEVPAQPKGASGGAKPPVAPTSGSTGHASGNGPAPRVVSSHGALGGVPQISAEESARLVEAAQAADGEDDPPPELEDRDFPSEADLLAALQRAFAPEAVLPGVIERYARHAHLVLEGTRRLNLTSIFDADEIAVKHYLDSWRATRLLPLMGRKVVDLGSGAGYPGMPTALCEPNCSVTMVETRKKRADFIQQSIDAMGVKNARAVWARGEEWLARNKVDVVFVRALSSVRENVRLLRKVRHSFTDLVMFKGPSWSREMRAAEREAERLGFYLDTVFEHELPLDMGQRAILVYRSPGAR